MKFYKNGRFGSNLVWVLVMTSMIFLNACEGFQKKASEEGESEVVLPVVELLTPEELEENVSTLVAYGKVESLQDFPLTFQVNGELDRFYVKAGDHVQAGQTIARLKNEVLLAQKQQAEAGFDAMYNTFLSLESGANDYSIAAARSNVVIAEKTMDGLKDKRDALEDLDMDTSELDLQIDIQEELLNQAHYNYEMVKMGASDEALNAQWALVKQAAAGLNGVISTYNETVLRAPFAGEVTTLMVNVGDPILPGQQIGILLNREQIEAVTHLSTEDAETISVHNEVEIEGGGSGEVFGISSRVDEMTQKRKVRVALDTLGDLIVGDTVRMEFEQDAASGLTLLPLSAVIFDGDEHYVLAFEAGVLERLEIDALGLRGEFLEVDDFPNVSIVKEVSGLRNGQKVIAQ